MFSSSSQWDFSRGTDRWRPPGATSLYTNPSHSSRPEKRGRSRSVSPAPEHHQSASPTAPKNKKKKRKRGPTVIPDPESRPNPYTGRNIFRSPSLLQTVLESGFSRMLPNGKMIQVGAQECQKYRDIIASWLGSKSLDLHRSIHMESVYACSKRSGLDPRVSADIWDDMLRVCPLPYTRSHDGRQSMRGINSILPIEGVILGLKMIHAKVNEPLSKFVQRMSYNQKQSVATGIDPDFKFSFNVTEARTVVRSQFRVPVELRERYDPEMLNHHFLVACSEGDVRAIHRLLKDGASVRFKDPKDHMTALHKAIMSNNEAAVDVVLRNGADPNARCRDLQNGGAEITTLIHAIMWANVGGDLPDSIYGHLFRAGVRLNDSVPDYGTPLHVAVGSNNIAACKLLLDAGADCEYHDFRHKDISPYELAKELDMIRCIQLMEDRLNRTTRKAAVPHLEEREIGQGLHRGDLLLSYDEINTEPHKDSSVRLDVDMSILRLDTVDDDSINFSSRDQNGQSSQTLRDESSLGDF